MAGRDREPPSPVPLLTPTRGARATWGVISPPAGPGHLIRSSSSSLSSLAQAPSRPIPFPIDHSSKVLAEIFLPYLRTLAMDVLLLKQVIVLLFIAHRHVFLLHIHIFLHSLCFIPDTNKTYESTHGLSVLN